MSEISERYRRLADGFTARVEAVPDDRWASQSPCPDWTARDVVGHLIDAHHMFFGLIDHKVERNQNVADDPRAAWAETRDAMQAALEDADVAGTEYDGFLGRTTWEASVAQFVCGDTLVHTWDLARAAGLDDRLDPDEVRAVRASADNFPQELMRQPTVFGPEVEPPPDADEQERLLAYVGRDPRWTAP
jgi:uncharacterized protein (TIGR03086 family)